MCRIVGITRVNEPKLTKWGAHYVCIEYHCLIAPPCLVCQILPAYDLAHSHNFILLKTGKYRNWKHFEVEQETPKNQKGITIRTISLLQSYQIRRLYDNLLEWLVTRIPVMDYSKQSLTT